MSNCQTKDSVDFKSRKAFMGIKSSEEEDDYDEEAEEVGET